MKKLLVTLLLTAMTCTMFACGTEDIETPPSEEIVSEENSNSEGTASEEVSAESVSTVTILADIWNAFAEEEKFSVMGGDMNNMVDGAPGAFDISNTEYYTGAFNFAAELTEDIDEGASLIHAMNGNTFTGVAVHLKDASKVDDFTTTLKDGVVGTQWMCGFPDTLVIYTVNGECVVYAYGNKEVIDNFKAKVSEVYGENATLAVEENLAR